MIKEGSGSEKREERDWEKEMGKEKVEERETMIKRGSGRER